MVDFNEVRPHDALGGKTPSEVYRDSQRRSLAPIVPSDPPERKTRRVSRVGNISVSDDVVFVSTALAGQIIGLQQESALRWRAHFFGVDLGPIEIIPLCDAVTGSDPVTPTSATVSTPQASRSPRTVSTAEPTPPTRKRRTVSA